MCCFPQASRGLCLCSRPSEAPAEWQKESPHLILQCWISTFLAPSPAFAGPIDPTSQAARLPGLYLWAQGQANREKPRASGHRTAPLEDLSG